FDSNPEPRNSAGVGTRSQPIELARFFDSDAVDRGSEITSPAPSNPLAGFCDREIGVPDWSREDLDGRFHIILLRPPHDESRGIACRACFVEISTKLPEQIRITVR